MTPVFPATTCLDVWCLSQCVHEEGSGFNTR